MGVPLSSFCAGHMAGSKDACGGDSGGPLVVKDSNNNPTAKEVHGWFASLPPFGIFAHDPRHPGHLFIVVLRVASWCTCGQEGLRFQQPYVHV